MGAVKVAGADVNHTPVEGDLSYVGTAIRWECSRRVSLLRGTPPSGRQGNMRIRVRCPEHPGI